MKTIMKKRKFCLVQFPNCCLVIYKEDEVFYIFDPYQWMFKNVKKEEIEFKASWIMYKDARQIRNKIKSCMKPKSQDRYGFYTFEVMSVRRAPRSVIIKEKLLRYATHKAGKPEDIGKLLSFYFHV